LLLRCFHFRLTFESNKELVSIVLLKFIMLLLVVSVHNLVIETHYVVVNCRCSSCCWFSSCSNNWSFNIIVGLHLLLLLLLKLIMLLLVLIMLLHGLIVLLMLIVFNYFFKYHHYCSICCFPLLYLVLPLSLHYLVN
jgi:hypothetical protein